MNIFPSLFGAQTIAYAALVPVVFLQMMALAFIPSMLVNGSRAREVGKALYCYTMQSLGIFLMSISGVPALYGLLTDAPLGQNIYMSLLLIFSIGALTFLLYEHASHTLDDVSKAVPHALYFYTLKFLGSLMVILATISLAVTMIFSSGATVRPDFWVTPLIFILYGIVISACTTWPSHSGQKQGSFQKSPLVRPPFPPMRPTTVQKVPVSSASSPQVKPKAGVMKSGGKKK